MRLCGFIVVLAWCALTGCNDTNSQRRLAVSAAESFRVVYNEGSCQQLYDDSSLYFKSHETSGRWFRDCAELQSRFGRWTGFKTATGVTWPLGEVGIVWIKGPAQFEKGNAQVRLDWNLSSGKAVLTNLLIEVSGEQISIPGFTGTVRG
jgi:hypothetical protein